MSQSLRDSDLEWVSYSIRKLGYWIKEISNLGILKDILVFSLPYKFNKFLET